MKKGLLLLAVFAAFKLFANTPPYIDPTYLTTRSVCAEADDEIYADLRILDDDYDAVTIVSISTSGGAVFTPGSFTYNIYQTAGTVINTAYISGTSFQTGTTTLDIVVTDGTNNTTLSVGPISAINVPVPVFLTDTISICSNDGIVDLNQFVNIPAGDFYISNLEVSYYQGILDAANPYIPPETYELLSYSYSNICYFSIQTNIVVHNAPGMQTSWSAPDCGTSNGNCSIIYSGGTSPYSIVWSTGAQNVDNISNIPAGAYQVQLIDSNGCTQAGNFQLSSASIDYSTTVTPPLCYEQPNGSIDVQLFGMTAPYDVLWSSGHSSLNIANIPAGHYTANITDASGCVAVIDEILTDPAELETYGTMYFPSCGATDGSIAVDSTNGGLSPYAYSWSNGGSGVSQTNLGYGIYSLTTTDGNGCTSINTFYLSEAGAIPVYLNQLTPANCGSNDGAIDIYVDLGTGQTVNTISWSNGATTEDIATIPQGTYVCTLATTDGCTSLKGWDLPVVSPELQPICVVTVDSATTTNLVVWEPAQTTGIAYYNIYRETSTPNDFMLIDTVNADNHSIFNDVVASPQQQSWKYKISAVNACNVEGALSPAHQTIHLDAISAGTGSTTISWNPYIGTAFSSYRLSRYTNTNGWTEIAQLPVSTLNYTDAIDITTAGLDYMVEFDLDEPCTALIYRSQDFNSSRSNKDKGNFYAGSGTGVSNNGLEEAYLNAISLYPNPVTSDLTVKQEGSEKLKITVLSLTGNIILNEEMNGMTNTLKLSHLSAGAYIVTIEYAGMQKNERIIKN